MMSARANQALSRQFAVRSNNEHKRLIKQDFGMEVLLLSCGPRNQQIDPALTQFLDLMFARDWSILRPAARRDIALKIFAR